MAAINIDLRVTEKYEKRFDLEELVAEVIAASPELAETVSALDGPGFAAFLHRLRIDQPDHPVIEFIWTRMEPDGEVEQEDWSFAP